MTDRQTDEGTDICDCRVTFATENKIKSVDFFHTWGNPHFYKSVEKRMFLGAF